MATGQQSNPASAASSPESRALRQHCHSLVTAIASPLQLSWNLFARGIIDNATREKTNMAGLITVEKNNILISAVLRSVDSNPSLFHHFTALLSDEDDNLKSLGMKLELSYSQSLHQAYLYGSTPTDPVDYFTKPIQSGMQNTTQTQANQIPTCVEQTQPTEIPSSPQPGSLTPYHQQYTDSRLGPAVGPPPAKKPRLHSSPLFTQQLHQPQPGASCQPPLLEQPREPNAQHFTKQSGSSPDPHSYHSQYSTDKHFTLQQQQQSAHPASDLPNLPNPHSYCSEHPTPTQHFTLQQQQQSAYSASATVHEQWHPVATPDMHQEVAQHGKHPPQTQHSFTHTNGKGKGRGKGKGEGAGSRQTQVKDKACTIHHHSPQCFGYAKYLKSVYQSQKIPRDDKWPPTISQHYINLALIKKQKMSRSETNKFTKATIHGDIDDIYNKKVKFDLQNIAQLDNGKFPRLILIEGAPGVGKSTLGWELCHRWSEGEILQQYKLVVLLRCRDRWVREAKTVANLFRMPSADTDTLKNATLEIQRSLGEGVLLLLEGFDELPSDVQTDYNSLLMKLITGVESPLPSATVLVTSRPSASGCLHTDCAGRISQHIEVLGFTKENIKAYLESAMDDSELLSGIQQYLECYPNIRGMMYIPLNCVIVVTVYCENRKEQQMIPKTKTELYSSLIRTLLLHYLRSNPQFSKQKWRITKFTDLPEDVYQQFCQLCKIAHDGIHNKQQVIFSDLPEDLNTLGLMQSVPELYTDESTTCNTSHNFLHLTVQEYMAAFFLSQNPTVNENPFEVYGPHPKKYAHFQVVLRFLAGLTKMCNFTDEQLKSLLTTDGDITHNALRWIFESQNWELFQRVSENSEIRFRVGTLTDCFDFFILGFSIAHSGCRWSLYNWSLQEERMEMLILGVCEAKPEIYGTISHVDLTKQHINTNKKIQPLFFFTKLPRAVMETCKSVCVSLSGLSDIKVQQQLCELGLNMPYLDIDLSRSSSTCSDVDCVLSMIPKTSLQKLNLSEFCNCLKHYQYLGKLLSSTTHLKMLDISGNTLSFKAIDALINGLNNNGSLKKLVMKKHTSRLIEALLIASIQTSNTGLEQICLEDCDIHISHVADGSTRSLLFSNVVNEHTVKCIQAFADNPHPRKLDITHCGVSHEDVQFLGELLSSPTTKIEELDVGNRVLSSKAIDALLSGLNNSRSSLRKLVMRGCTFYPHNAKLFASLLSTNDTIEQLYLKDCDIHIGHIAMLEFQHRPLDFSNVVKESTVELVKAFVTHSDQPYKLDYSKLNTLSFEDCQTLGELLSSPSTQLEELDVSCNSLFSEAIAGLAPTHKCHLTCLDLHANKRIGRRGTVELIRSLSSHAVQLRKLILWETNIGVEDCEALGKLLSSPAVQLEELDVSCNDLSPEAIAGLAPTHKCYLTCLNLGYNREIGRRGAIELIRSLSSHAFQLRKLILNATRIGVEDCEALGELLSSPAVQLEELDVSCNDLSPETIAGLAPTHKCYLTCLDLHGNRGIGRRGAVELIRSLSSHAFQLRKLILNVTKIGLEDCEALGKLLSSPTVQLEELDVSCNDLSPEAIASLAPTHKCYLTCLDLGYNRGIGRRGAVELIKSLSSHAFQLRKLILNATKICVEDCEALGELLSSPTVQLEELDVSCNDLSPEAIAGLAPTHKCYLTCLDLHNNTGIDRRGAVELITSLSSHAFQLRKLILNKTKIGVEDCAALGKLLSSPTVQLEELDISENDLSPEAIAGLAPTHKCYLTCLDLHANRGIGRRGGAIELITSLSSHAFQLRKLILWETKIGVEDCEALGKLLSSPTVQLEELYLSWNSLSPEAIAGLAPTHKCYLTCLDLHANRGIGRRGAVELIKSLSSHAFQLRNLILNQTKIGVEDCEALGKLLSSPTVQLEELDVSCNDLSPKAIAGLAPTHKCHLTCLDLGGNTGIGRRGAVELIRSLSSHAFHLRKLILKQTKIGLEDCEALGNLLSSPTVQLKELDVSCNDLSPEARAALAPTNKCQLKC